MNDYTADGDLIPIQKRLNDEARIHRFQHSKQNTAMKNMADRVSVVEDMLSILHRDLDYENEFPELREAYEHYNTILAKYKTFKALTPDGDTTYE